MKTKTTTGKHTPGTVMESDCGCRFAKLMLIFCPLHAAAPELLAALKAMAERFPPSHGLTVLADAEEAIAKAEGKEAA